MWKWIMASYLIAVRKNDYLVGNLLFELHLLNAFIYCN